MSKLAIRGHKERGEEVIKILEMFGLENEYKLSGTNEKCAYYEKNGRIHNTATVGFNNFKLFTIEEFLEKFPYKIGDVVWVYNTEFSQVTETITCIRWDIECGCIIYDTNAYHNLTVEHLQPYKVETMEKTIKAITIEDFKANTKEWLIDTLESMSKDDALQTICDLHDELQKLPSKEDIKDSIARNAASGWCRCFKCDGIIRDTHTKCDQGKLITCHQWYDGYRTALLALGDNRLKEMYK